MPYTENTWIHIISATLNRTDRWYITGFDKTMR